MASGNYSSGLFPPEWLDALRARLDIVQVVSQYVALHPKGGRHWGLCPFHGEKTPSFSVDAQKQFYYCFGCHKGGDAIGFVRDMERMDFVEAVKFLAEQVRLELPDMQKDAEVSLKSRVISANALAAELYQRQLFQKEGREALEYLYRRGLDDAVIRKFRIGATFPGWDGLTKRLLDKGFTPQELVRGGLCGQKGERIYDLFRNRVIFPIINAQDKVIGFGGRALGEQTPKYLNSPDTPAFNKRAGLYAMHLIRHARKLEHVTLVEGYMDVVAMTQAGVEGVVATLGTAMTAEQGRLIARYAPTVRLAYDGDKAGQNAILKALDICQSIGLAAKVLDFPGGLDPDDFVRQKGAAELEKLKAVDAVVYRMRRATDGKDLAKAEDRAAYAMACAQLIKKVENPVEREMYVRQLAVDTGFSVPVLLEQMGQPSAAPKTPPPRAQKAIPAPAAEEKPQRWLLAVLATGRVDRQVVPLEVFERPLYRQTAQALEAGVSVSQLIGEAPDEEARSLLAQVFQEDMPEEDGQLVRMVEDCLASLRMRHLQTELDEVRRCIAGAEGDQRQAYTRELMRLLTEEQQLKSSGRR